MLTGKFAIYDNDFGTDWEIVISTIYDWVQQNGASVAIVDNLMALDIQLGNVDKYEMQSRIAKEKYTLFLEIA